jgi:hypothetical protein
VLRFDWKWSEPEDARRADPRDDPNLSPWPPLQDGGLLGRYDHISVETDGAEQGFAERVRVLWRDLVEPLPRLEGDFGEDWRGLQRGCLELQDSFFAAADSLFAEKAAGAKRSDCVFISHQRADAYRGERIACLADHRSVDVWLDVHNPTLRWLNANPVSAPVRSLLIAAIVEIALLNSTHVIALHTASSLASRWVPYELARAKARGVTSAQAAGWFEDAKNPLKHGDYVQLAAMLFDEQEVFDWLPSKAPAVRPPPHCGMHLTKAL